MSDAGGGQPGQARRTWPSTTNPANPPLPDESQITSGRYQPTNYFPPDIFASSLATPSGGSALSVFDQTNPNGTWELYVMDDDDHNKGRLSGWQLVIQATGLNALE